MSQGSALCLTTRCTLTACCKAGDLVCSSNPVRHSQGRHLRDRRADRCQMQRCLQHCHRQPVALWIPLTQQHRAHPCLLHALLQRASLDRQLFSSHGLIRASQSRATSSPCRALSTAGDTFEGIRQFAQLGLLGVYLAAILKSAAPLLKKDLKPRQQAQDPEDEESRGVQWGVMAIISFLPLFDWLVRQLLLLHSCRSVLKYQGARQASLQVCAAGFKVCCKAGSLLMCGCKTLARLSFPCLRNSCVCF